MRDDTLFEVNYNILDYCFKNRCMHSRSTLDQQRNVAQEEICRFAHRDATGAARHVANQVHWRMGAPQPFFMVLSLIDTEHERVRRTKRRPGG